MRQGLLVKLQQGARPGQGVMNASILGLAVVLLASVSGIANGEVSGTNACHMEKSGFLFDVGGFNTTVALTASFVQDEEGNPSGVIQGHLARGLDAPMMEGLEAAVMYEITVLLPRNDDCKTPEWESAWHMKGSYKDESTEVPVSTDWSSAIVKKHCMSDEELEASTIKGYEWTFDYAAQIAKANVKTKVALKAAGLKGQVMFALDDVFEDGFSFAILKSFGCNPLGLDIFRFEHKFNIVDLLSSETGCQQVECSHRCKKDGAMCFRVGTGTKQVCAGNVQSVGAECKEKTEVSFGVDTEAIVNKIEEGAVKAWDKVEDQAKCTWDVATYLTEGFIAASKDVSGKVRHRYIECLGGEKGNDIAQNIKKSFEKYHACNVEHWETVKACFKDTTKCAEDTWDKIKDAASKVKAAAAKAKAAVTGAASNLTAVSWTFSGLFAAVSLSFLAPCFF